MDEQFWGRLRERANAEAFSQGERWEIIEDVELGITATIEALKEMMVDRPAVGKLKHDEEVELTTVEEFDLAPLTFGGHIGTDGEEVIVMVMRLS